MQKNNKPKLVDNVQLKDIRIRVQGIYKDIDSKIINGKTYIRLSDDNLEVFNECFRASVVKKKDGITRVKVGFRTYELKLGDKTKGGYYKLKVIDSKNYILLTYLAEELAKCSVIWQEQLREVCVVEGKYIGNGLVKGKKDLDANYLTNIYGEQLYTVRRGWLKNELTPVYVTKKLFTNEDEFCIKIHQGIIPTYVTLDKNTLIMPKSAWKEVDLSLTSIEKFHDIMDATSLVPVFPISVGADLANAAVYAMEKDYTKMWFYLGFATVSVVTAGIVSPTKVSKKVGIKLTEKKGAKNLPKNTKKMTIKEYEKSYGKAYVEVTSYEKITIELEETSHNKVNIIKIARNTEEGIIKAVNKEKIFIKNRAQKIQILIKEGKNFQKNRLVEVVKDSFAYTKSEQYKWLEKGNEKAGEIHIFIRHGEELSERGIKNGRNIGDKLLEFGETEPICRLVTKKGPSTIYKDNKGKFYLYAHGDNGFSVTLYPLKNRKAVDYEMKKAIEYSEYISGKGWGEIIKNVKD